MFTGLVEAVGVIVAVQRRREDLWSLSIEAPAVAAEMAPGQSLCVSGACLTVTSSEGGRCVVDVMAETMRRTTLKDGRPGTRVNLERALAVGGRLDGHIVSGHVDCTSKIRRIGRGRDGHVLSFLLPGDRAQETVSQGSIAVDGVSLTVSAMMGAECSVSLIPSTLERTTLGGLAVGDEVNIETDILGKYVRRVLGRGTTALSAQDLENAGWLESCGRGHDRVFGGDHG